MFRCLVLSNSFFPRSPSRFALIPVNNISESVNFNIPALALDHFFFDRSVLFVWLWGESGDFAGCPHPRRLWRPRSQVPRPHSGFTELFSPLRRQPSTQLSVRLNPQLNQSHQREPCIAFIALLPSPLYGPVQTAGPAWGLCKPPPFPAATLDRPSSRPAISAQEEKSSKFSALPDGPTRVCR